MDRKDRQVTQLISMSYELNQAFSLILQNYRKTLPAGSFTYEWSASL